MTTQSADTQKICAGRPWYQYVHGDKVASARVSGDKYSSSVHLHAQHAGTSRHLVADRDLKLRKPAHFQGSCNCVLFVNLGRLLLMFWLTGELRGQEAHDRKNGAPVVLERRRRCRSMHSPFECVQNLDLKMLHSVTQRIPDSIQTAQCNECGVHGHLHAR